MFCSSCGEGLLDGAKFCAHCGVQAEAVMQPIQGSTGKSEKSTLRAAYNSASQTVSRTANVAKNIGGMVATQIGDLNGDGNIDAEDFKIAAARAKQFASAVGAETVKLSKSTLQSDLVKEVSAGAAVGAVIAVPVPVIGPVAGAVVGASLGVYKHFIKK